MYNANDIKIQTTRGAILRGWRVPKEGLWKCMLVKDACKTSNQNTDTACLAVSPQQLLMHLPPPATSEAINTVYELKTKPELVRYYHAAEGFPTKPSWLEAINKGNYSSWTGLDATLVAKYFPESEEIRKGHGRKIKSGRRSTTQLLKQEEAEVQKAQQQLPT